jgi:hypothetical protein
LVRCESVDTSAGAKELSPEQYIEAAADRAARTLKNWEKASEYMKLDAIGVLIKDETGKIKAHKLGKQAGRKGIGIGVALGLIAATLSGGLTLAGGVVVGGIGGGIIGRFFHKGLKVSDEDMARIAGELEKVVESSVCSLGIRDRRRGRQAQGAEWNSPDRRGD